MRELVVEDRPRVHERGFDVEDEEKDCDLVEPDRVAAARRSDRLAAALERLELLGVGRLRADQHGERREQSAEAEREDDRQACWHVSL